MLIFRNKTVAILFNILFPVVIVPVLFSLSTLSNADAAATNKYCVSGNSTGAGWSISITTWNPPAGGAVGSGGDCPGIPEGSDCVALTQAFVDCINDNIIEGQGSASVDPDDPCCFIITSWWNQIDLYVGPFGELLPDCEVTEAGCPFNPFVYKVSAGPEEKVPTLSEWGLIVLALLLLTGAACVIWRRRRAAAA